MKEGKPVLFDLALDIAIEKTKAVGAVFGHEVVLVRDLLGRIRLLLPGGSKDCTENQELALAGFSEELSESLGAYGYGPNQTVLFLEDFLQDDESSIRADRRLIEQEGDLKIWLLDRQLVGQDWMRSSLPRTTVTRRVTFFGIKGGVGRSTALVIWAWNLAKKRKNVLFFDLDLESPGVSSTLLPPEYLPDYGIVDWFVEDGVGQGGVIEENMVAISPLSAELPGEIRVVPAFGQVAGDYLPKLARCYVDFTTEGAVLWGERVQRLVERLEKKEKPDVVFFDSRAGLHDIAAVLVTRMDADTFLFAADSAQTWAAYSFLFKNWRKHPQIKEFRNRLQIVAGMVPETGREEYLKRFREHSWDMFREYLYDEVQPDDLEAFSFDLTSEEAPHYPLRIFWHRALQEFDPAVSETGLDEKISRDTMDDFMDGAERIVFPDQSGG